MDRVLVAYGSRYGSTAEIAEAIGGALAAVGFEVDVRPARAVRSLDGYSGVVVGSAVYMGRWRGEALRLLERHRAALAGCDVWLFSSGPVGEDDPDEDDAEAERWTKPVKARVLAAEIGAHDHAVFGGRVDEDRGLMRKWMARNMPETTRDRRDWDAITAWSASIARVLASTGGPPPNTT